MTVEATGTVTGEQILRDCISEADALARALDDERRALETRDAAALGAAAEEKRRRVVRLEALDAARIAATRQVTGATAAGTGPAATVPADEWRQFLAIVARCQDLNATNGAIIRLRRQQVTDTLRVVSGNGAATYDLSGSPSTSHRKHALAAI